MIPSILKVFSRSFSKGVKMKVEDIKETRDGRRVRIICLDAKIDGGVYDIVGLIKEPDGNEFIEWWDSEVIVDGYILAGDEPGNRDIKI